jgi:hypothetical protein
MRTADAATSPVILGATINYTTNQITATGLNFSPDNLSTPTVVLAGTKLAVISFTDKTVIAELPSAISTGSYQLSITNNQKLSGNFSITVGAAGPPGSPGPIGPQGAQGPPGPQVPKVWQALPECQGPPVRLVRKVLAHHRFLAGIVAA